MVVTAVVGISGHGSNCVGSCGAVLGPAVQSLPTAFQPDKGGIHRTRSFFGQLPFVALALLNGFGLRSNATTFVLLQSKWLSLLVTSQNFAKAPFWMVPSS